MNLNRRDFLTALAVAAGYPMAKIVGGAIGDRLADVECYSTKSRGAAGQTDPKTIDNIVNQEPSSAIQPNQQTEKVEDGWYIQYSFNKDISNYQKNKDFLNSNNYSNVHRLDEKTGTRTLIGRFSSWDDAVQEADRLSDFVKDINEVGIINIDKGIATWRDTVRLSPNKPPQPHKIKTMPQWINVLVEQETELYNKTARTALSPNQMLGIMERENPEYDPNKPSYKVKKVRNNNSKTKAARPYILVYRTDKQGNKIPSGAYGLTMVTKEAMKEVGLDPKKILDPRMNIRAGIRYFGKWLDEFGNESQALIAYNSGPSRARKPFNKLPMETREYVTAVAQNYHR